MNIFKSVKEAVSTKEAASFYGIKVSRNGMCCCPFHNDKHPSMKVDNRYHCFACGADGDVINFTASLFNLSQYEAAQKLINDFRLNIDIHTENYFYHRPPREELIKKTIEQNKLKAFQIYKRDALRDLHDYYRILHSAKITLAPSIEEGLDNCHPLFEEALNNLDKMDWMIEEIETSNLTTQLEFFNTYKEEIANVRKRLTEYNTNTAAE